MNKKQPAKLLIGVLCILLLIAVIAVALLLDSRSPDPVLGIFQTEPTIDMTPEPSSEKCAFCKNERAIEASVSLLDHARFSQLFSHNTEQLRAFHSRCQAARHKDYIFSAYNLRL